MGQPFHHPAAAHITPPTRLIPLAVRLSNELKEFRQQTYVSPHHWQSSVATEDTKLTSFVFLIIIQLPAAETVGLSDVYLKDFMSMQHNDYFVNYTVCHSGPVPGT